MSYYLIAENIDDAWETLMEELYNQRDILHLNSRDGVVVGELLNT